MKEDCVDEDDNGDKYDEIDRQFDELDELVEIAKAGAGDNPSSSLKYCVPLRMINLMIEEVDTGDIRIYQQIGGNWVAEVKYHGVLFIHVNGKHKPEAWKEFENG